MFGRLQLSKVKYAKSSLEIDSGVLAANNKTIYFFRLNPIQSEILDIDEVYNQNLQQEEETKFSQFFRKIKDKVMTAITFDLSRLKIHLE
jgi:hypothetical protein